jgi:hypothetical protein
MAFPLAAGLLFEAVPALLRLFGKDKPAEIVEKAASIAKTLTGTNTPEDALTALQADPAKMAEYVAAVEERAIAWFKLYLEDIQSARSREVELVKAGFKDNTLKALIFAAFFGLAACIAVVVWLTDLPEYAKGILTLFIGRALGWVEQIYSYYFGTTRSSKQKDATIEKQAESLLK